MEHDEYIFGIRAVIEAIEAGKDIDKILVKKDIQSGLIGELTELVRRYRIPTRRVPVERINKITRKNHQGVVALLSRVSYYSLGNVVPALFENGIVPLMVVLDGITDVRNFGAIARTCECVGANAIVIPEHGSAWVNADAVKTSAGALNHIPVCREHTVAAALKYLKNSGYQIIAVTEKGELAYTAADLTVPTALVMGAEDTGISQEALERCDKMISIPMFGNIGSLNVSVAAGVVLYEAVRQRLASGAKVN